MRRLLAWNVMTLDGYFEGPEPWSLDFHEIVYGEDLQALSAQQLRDAGLLLFGRKTYEGMANYWPTASEPEAAAMNSISKAVITNTLTSAGWNNTRLLRGDGVEIVKGLKEEPGKDIYVFGSAELLASLLAYGLVDEYRICIAPVLLGRGNPLFKTGDARRTLELQQARQLDKGGGVLLSYALGSA